MTQLMNLFQEYLNSFLAVAEKLKVRGLWEEGSGKTALDERPPRSSPKTSNSRPVSPPAKRAKLVQVKKILTASDRAGVTIG